MDQQHQYHTIYRTRLQRLRKHVMAHFTSTTTTTTSPKQVRIGKYIMLPHLNAPWPRGKDIVCVVVAMVSIDYKKRVNLVKAFETQSVVAFERNVTTPSSQLTDACTYFLEDEHGRLQVDATTLERRRHCTTGVVAFFMCQRNEEEDDIIHVRKVVYPGIDVLSKSHSSSSQVDAPLVCVSGVATFHEREKQRQRITTALCRIASAPPPQCTGLVMLGPFVPDGLEVRLEKQRRTRDSVLMPREQLGKLKWEHMKALGVVFQAWSRSELPVWVAPGYGDLTTYALPQAPLLPALLNVSPHRKQWYTIPNPSWQRIHERTVLFMSAQVVRNTLSTSTFTTPLDAVGAMMRWRHICPSMPDFDAVVVSGEEDPLLFPETLQSAPNVVVVGSDAELWCEGLVRNLGDVLVVFLPCFSQCHQVAEIDVERGSARLLSL